MKKNNLNRDNIYKNAISHYGKLSQEIQSMEEMAELIKELSKDIRGKSTKTQILTEVADVTIMLEQLKIMFNITEEEIEEEIDFKLVRLMNRINEGENNESIKTGRSIR